MTGEGCVWVTYCGGFKCLQLGVFFIPCHKHLHAGLDATSESDCSQRRSAVSCWFIYEGFLGKHWCLPQVPLYWEWPLQLLACLAPVGLPILSRRWRQRRISTAKSLGSPAREKTSSHHYHDICKPWWWFSNCEFWYAAHCFNYCKLLFQTLP